MRALLCALVFSAGCASSTHELEIPPLPATPPPELPVASESLQAAWARQVVIVPLRTPNDELANRMRALALGQLLAHAIENDPDAAPQGLAHQAGLYPSGELA
ncbi:MAG TPA: hypothetical protein PK095_18285, partial [Myxococcota bacterium]|nr:hypothetical protein [Myxococcota bacterium]